MSKFKVGDYVEVVKAYSEDEIKGITVGTRGYVLNNNSDTLYVNFIDKNLNFDKCTQLTAKTELYYYPMNDYQLELVESEEKEMNKIEKHMEICSELNQLYEAKNADYGDSFGKSYKEYGLTMACIRLEDKLNRLKSLNFNKTNKVKDESLIDTLMDLANYSIMTIIELESEE